jgi:hypothetical protein
MQIRKRFPVYCICLWFPLSALIATNSHRVRSGATSSRMVPGLGNFDLDEGFSLVSGFPTLDQLSFEEVAGLDNPESVRHMGQSSSSSQASNRISMVPVPVLEHSPGNLVVSIVEHNLLAKQERILIGPENQSPSEYMSPDSNHGTYKTSDTYGERLDSSDSTTQPDNDSVSSGSLTDTEPTYSNKHKEIDQVLRAIKMEASKIVQPTIHNP